MFRYSDCISVYYLYATVLFSISMFPYVLWLALWAGVVQSVKWLAGWVSVFIFAATLTNLGPTEPPVLWALGLFLRGYSSRSVQLVPMLRMCGAWPSLPVRLNGVVFKQRENFFTFHTEWQFNPISSYTGRRWTVRALRRIRRIVQ
jgi:hypothetical protein